MISGKSGSEARSVSSPESNFARMLLHAGWGDPIRGLWFVGIEEGSGWSGSPEAVEQWFEERRESIRTLGGMTYETGTNSEGLPAATRSRVRYWEQAIVDRVRGCRAGSAPTALPPLWAPGSRVFHTNLYPLARPSVAAWPEYFGAMFGVSTAASYKEAIQRRRFRMLREARDEAEAQATVCFGKSYWSDFERALAIEPASGQLVSGGKLKRYDDVRVICAPFFGYWHMKKNLADDISAILREWGVDLGY